ncbi:GM25670 [Drosophila sechellia]|nr:GM25670 [Drosophila sechellia]
MLLKVCPCDEFQVQHKVVKKQPKFPTRERHMAIRRKKSTAMVTTTSEKSAKCPEQR